MENVQHHTEIRKSARTREATHPTVSQTPSLRSRNVWVDLSDGLHTHPRLPTGAFRNPPLKAGHSLVTSLFRDLTPSNVAERELITTG